MADKPGQNVVLMEVLSSMLLFIQGVLLESGIVAHRPRWSLIVLALSAGVVVISRLVMILARERLLRTQHGILVQFRERMLGQKLEEIRHG